MAVSTMIGRLKAVRRELGLTQKTLAEKLGISHSMVMQMERGARDIADKTIRLICERCSVNEKWLRFGEGRMFEEGKVDTDIERRDSFRQFARAFGLTPSKQLQVAEIVNYQLDAADLYSEENISSASDSKAVKRNVARLLKAVERGSVGRTSAHITSS